MMDVELLANAFETAGLTNTFPLPEEVAAAPLTPSSGGSPAPKPLPPEPAAVCIIGGCQITCGNGCVSCQICAVKQSGG